MTQIEQFLSAFLNQPIDGKVVAAGLKHVIKLLVMINNKLHLHALIIELLLVIIIISLWVRT